MEREKYKTLYNLHKLNGKLAYCLAVFGDTLGKREGYENYHGIDAVYFYLIKKYHWLPSQVRSMSYEDLRFLLEDEMKDWTLPKEAIFEGETE